MRVGVLGSLEVTSTDGSLLPVRGAKERLLLGILAAEASRSVSVRRLVDLLWDGIPPSTAVKTLQSHVARLRTALEPARPRGSSGRYLVRRGPGYALAVERDEVDAVQFTDLVARGRARLVSGSPAAARDEIAAALALWRGMPYADWPEAGFAEAERRRLAEVRVTAVEGRLDADLALGRHAEVIPELERLVVDEPLHEGWWSRLMLALYRAGRQGDALAAARRARSALADELGIDPGPELARLEASILAQDPGLVRFPPTPAPPQLRPPPSIMCPYKGLAAYRPEDAALFHGRSKLIRTLVATLVDSQLLVVSGPSGAGKSSVVLAGLLPALAAGALPGSVGWRQTVIVPGANPVDALAAPFDREATSPAVLVVDQSEELWTAGAVPAERRAFLDTMLGLLDDGELTRLVVVVRGDHIGRLAEHGTFAERAAHDVVLVPPLSELELREVVNGPAETAGLSVEPELADAIVGDVLGQPGALPMLSTGLVGTWERRRRDVLTLAGYLEAGGVDGALARSAEAAYASLDTDARQRVQPMLVRLAGEGEPGVPVRRRVSREELGLDGPDGEARRRAVDAFLTRRLLTADEDTVEVAHEALFSAWPRLAAWLADDAAGRAIRDHLVPTAREWDQRGRPVEELYRGSRLATALDWRTTSEPDLTGVEQDFLDASEALADAELRAARARAAREAAGRRRTRWLAAALGVALAGSIAAGVVALHQRADAQREAQVAAARELAAAAIASLDVDPELSTLLALEAVETTRESDGTVLREAEEALHRTVSSLRLELTVPHGGDGLAVSPDGARFATGGHDGEMNVWDVRNGAQLLVLRGPAGAHVAFSPDGRIIASSHGDGTVRLWDADTGDELRVLRGHVGFATHPVFSPDGRWLAAGGEDATVRIWDVAQGTEEMALTGHEGATYRAAFSPDGARLATASEDTTARIWDLATGETLVTLEGHRWGVTAVDFSPDGFQIATASIDGSVRIWDPASGAHLRTFVAPVDLHAVAFSPDGTRIASAGTDAIARIWDADTGREVLTLAGHRGAAMNVVYTPDGDHLLTVGLDDTARLWDVSVGGGRDWLRVPSAELILVGVAFSPDGATFAAPAEPSGVTIWDTHTGDEIITLTGPEPKLTTVAFSPDGRSIAAGSDLTRTPPVWDAETGDLLFTLDGHASDVRAVTYSPNGSRLATGSWDGTAGVWDAATGEQIGVLSNGEVPVLTTAFSPDGRFIVTGDVEGNATVWDAVRLERVRTLSGHTAAVNGVTFGPAGLLLTASDDGTATIWDFDTGEVRVTLRGHTARVHQVAVSPDGTRIATSSDDGTVRLWDPATGDEQLALSGHSYLVYGVDFSPDGRLLATASPDGTAALHLLPVDELVEVARERVTRELTDDECRQYLHVERCA
ncbi:MAG: BTAD domain-containing putative transcriptional regulator [Jiangellaceae bacterium]